MPHIGYKYLIQSKAINNNPLLDPECNNVMVKNLIVLYESLWWGDHQIILAGLLYKYIISFSLF